jgi:enoyl-CoA hydratase/carnithine racemase
VPIEDLLVQRQSGVAIVTINRPDRLNAMVPQLQKLLLETLALLDEDPSVRAIVLTGAGRGFCAGADLSVLEGVESLVGTDALEAQAPNLRTPMIAAVNGPAVGIGFAIMLFADVIYMAEGARVSTLFSRLGLVAEWGSSWNLQRRLGHGYASDLLLTGRTVAAEEALSIGLVQRVLPADELVPAAIAWACDIATQASPYSTAVIKQQLHSGTSQTFQTAFDESLELEETSFGRPDLSEAIAARAEKRTPNFPPFTGY